MPSLKSGTWRINNNTIRPGTVLQLTVKPDDNTPEFDVIMAVNPHNGQISDDQKFPLTMQVALSYSYQLSRRTHPPNTPPINIILNEEVLKEEVVEQLVLQELHPKLKTQQQMLDSFIKSTDQTDIVDKPEIIKDVTTLGTKAVEYKKKLLRAHEEEDGTEKGLWTAEEKRVLTKDSSVFQAGWNKKGLKCPDGLGNANTGGSRFLKNRKCFVVDGKPFASFEKCREWISKTSAETTDDLGGGEKATTTTSGGGGVAEELRKGRQRKRAAQW